MVADCFDLESRPVESWQFLVTVIQSWVTEDDVCLLLVVHFSFLVTSAVVMYWCFFERGLVVCCFSGSWLCGCG